MGATSQTGPNRQPHPTPHIVGREREQRLLADLLEATGDGHGRLVLVGGEAGIGKTALVRWLADTAMSHGALVLAGSCYDLTATPPYGPWLDALAGSNSLHSPAVEADTPLPRNPLVTGVALDQTQATNQHELFDAFRRFLETVAARQPLVLVLEDLHWADPASLDLLRYLSRQSQSLPIMLVATYRVDEVTRGHPLFQLLPHLIREGPVERIDLRRLDADDVHLLITHRFSVAATDATRLVTYLMEHTEGNPFFLSEVLRTLEAERLLTPTTGGWFVGELTRAPVPLLVSQVIEGRLARLEDDTRRLLELAAIIGQVTPLDLWQAVSGVDGDVLLNAADQAIDANLLESSADGATMHFTHALVREAVYASIPPPRRRVRHNHVGDVLIETTNPDPDQVAHHLQQAGDNRAVDWLVLAGERAQRTYAWTIACDRFDAAAQLMAGQPARDRERAWLLHRLGMAMRWTNPERGAGYLEASARIAAQAGDLELAGSARAYHGLLLCFTGKVRQGLAIMEPAVTDLDALKPDQRRDIAGGVNPAKGALAIWLGIVGRFQESMDMANDVLGELTRHEIDTAALEGSDIGTWDPASQAGTQAGGSYMILARGLAMFGQPDAARSMYERSRTIYTAVRHFGMVYAGRTNELWELTIPYLSDQLSHREQVTAATASSWSRAQGAMGTDLSPRVTRLPLLVIEGDWSDLPDLVSQFRQAHANVVMHLRTMVSLGVVARAQGNAQLAWQQVHDGLPHGPNHEPGDSEFLAASMLQRLAVSLAIDEGDLGLARRWLDACDHWLNWSGAFIGRADVDLLWAIYLDARDELVAARRRSEQALELASEPRQPFSLIAIHRHLGQQALHDGDIARTEHHLDISLTIASNCGAPFERALTLLTLAELRLGSGQVAEARELLAEIRSICTPLDARPTLERVTDLESRAAPATFPNGLTPREVEVLRLIAAGHSNREIADALYISPRTIERHIANIYLKIDAHSKAEATAYAIRHHLA